MNGVTSVALMASSSLLGAVCAGCVSRAWQERRLRNRRKESALKTAESPSGESVIADAYGPALRYAESLSRRLYTGTATPLCPSVRAKRAGRTRAGRSYARNAVAAGCKKRISTAAYCETRFRMAIAGMLAGALAGALFSTELAVLLATAGALMGLSLPGRTVQELRRKRRACAERHLSEMLEVVALGLRSGLTFDRSFALYGSHFDNEFARACARSYRTWSLGLSAREESLRELAESFDSAQLARIVENVIRGLKFGSSITGALEEAAAQSRAGYRTALEERVAKAPVKMMLPTGTLILPAMLILVMGPILLELAGGF